jgi:hypothetical protein
MSGLSDTAERLTSPQRRRFCFGAEARGQGHANEELETNTLLLFFALDRDQLDFEDKR